MKKLSILTSAMLLSWSVVANAGTSAESAAKSADDMTMSADTIYKNGDIVLMTGENERAEAIAIKDGIIVAVGDFSNVKQYASEQTKLVNLNGNTMTPGFIDSHSHIAQYFALINGPFLYPSPMGTGDSIAQLQELVKSYFEQADLDKDKLHFAFGYDNAELKEQRHPTRYDFDQVSGDYAFCAMHISGHLATCNSNALKKIGYDRNTADPAGGLIHRDEIGTLTGTFEESATYVLFPFIQPSDDVVADYKKIENLFTRYGVTTTQEGLALPPAIKLLNQLAEQGVVNIDINLYAKNTELDRAMEIMPMGESNNGVKLAGVKFVGDGSPQGKTAYLSTPYVEVPEGLPFHYHGYPIIDQTEMDDLVDKAYSVNAQIISHTNGDASTDILLNALEKAAIKYDTSDRRPVAIHAQTARLDQIKRMKEIGVVPSFFAAHSYFWGDYHRESVLGEWRAANISPMGWANEVDLPFTIHMDAPVLFPDMLTSMWTAVNRVTRSGFVLGEEHKISAYQALETVTTTAAYQNFEEDSKGSIEVGKRADLVILDRNPTSVEPMMIKDIQVLETIKDGVTIFKKSEG